MGAAAATTTAGPVTPSGRRLPGRAGVGVLAAASLVCFGAAVVLATLVAGEWAAVLASDRAIDTAIHESVSGSAVVLGVAQVLQWTGSPVFLTALTTLVVIGLLIRRRPGYAAYLAATALGGVVLSESLKGLVARERPVWPDPLWIAQGYSFPSGHSLAGVTNWVVYGVIALLLIPGARGRAVAIAVMGWGLLMPAGRLALGVHWPADVVEGWLLGFGWVLAVSAVTVALVIRRAAIPAAPA